MNAVAVLVGALLAACVGILAAWWIFLFRRQLPLERALKSRQAELCAARQLATRLLQDQALAQHPAQAAAEAAGRALDALRQAHPRLAFAVVGRQKDAKPVLLAQRGDAWARVPLSAMNLEQGFLGRAARDGEATWNLKENGAEGDDLLAKALADLGFSSACARGWSAADSSGAMIAAEMDPAGQTQCVAEDLDMAFAGLRSAAAIATGISRLSDTLNQKAREVQTLHEVAQAMVTREGRGSSPLSAIVAIVARALEADLVAFLILDETTGELVTQPGAYGVEDEEALYRIPLTEERSSSVRVFKTRQPFISDDAQNDPSVIARYAQMWRIHSLLVVPLIIEDRVLGVMRIGSRRRGAFGPEALGLVTVVAEEASILIETVLLNRRLALTTEQFVALSRIKDEFVSTVSHEFKTPLTTIIGFLSVILEGETGPLNVQQVRFLHIVKLAAKRLSGLVSDLLDLSRLEGGAKMEARSVDIRELISQSVESLSPIAADGGKSLVWEKPARCPNAVGDARWLGLVLDNLIGNALKFSQVGGRVTVDVRDKGEFLMVSVADQGIGIPESDGEKIFERFHRASNRGEVNAPGTGLGLAIAREVVSKHGGKIWFESELTKGTTFRFVIPSSRHEPP